MGYDVYYNGEISISPPLTESDAAVLTAMLTNTPAGAPTFFASIEAASPKPELPWCTGLLNVSEDRTKLLPEENDRRHGLDTWLRIAVDHFLAPAGYVLNGSVDFEGEGAEDRGTIHIKDNRIEIVYDVIFQPGPTWDRAPYASEPLKNAIQDLLDSSDESGFSSDFIVVSSPALRALGHLLPLS